MLSQPASMLLQTISAVLSVSGNIKRLEGYLEKADIRDSRKIASNALDKSEGSTYMINIDNVLLDVSNGSKKILIDLKIMNCTTIMISGSVGSGKSTLLLMLLGEKVPSSGSITNRASSIGFCSPNPWLRNVTIKENIVNGKEWDDEWYHNVIYVCNLVTDLALLPRGSDTHVGSRGIALSGGQKHRVALARALYSRCSLLLLDETLGALDYQTRKTVADRLLKHVTQQKLTLIFISHDGKSKIEK
jgi:ATP-binding cassette subfamily C (CFTR/MRP) protein 1